MPWRLPAGAVECGGECNEVWGSGLSREEGLLVKLAMLLKCLLIKLLIFGLLIIRKSVDMCWQRICVQCSIGHRYGDKVKCGCIIVLYKCEIFLSSMTRKVYIAEYVVVLYLS